jgi:hypothetical protein
MHLGVAPLIEEDCHHYGNPFKRDKTYEGNSGRDYRASRAGTPRFSGATEHLNCTFTTSASRDTRESTGGSGIKGETDMSATRSVINPALGPLGVIVPSLLIFEVEGLAHLNRLSTRAIICCLANFEGDIVEETALGVQRVLTHGGELFTIAEGEDIAMTELDT